MKRIENTLKKYIMRTMGTRWDAQSHEDRYSTGVPDLSFSLRDGKGNGWIELKQVEKWGKEGSLVKPRKFTSEQINWLTKRHRYGGGCFVLVKVEKDYFIFSATMAEEIAKGMTKNGYFLSAIRCWHGSIFATGLTEALTEEFKK